ncbi:MAG: DinB family protein [Saprospiraceae bacterium]|nr:DinB family protein [Saprospiraceae bacterium]
MKHLTTILLLILPGIGFAQATTIQDGAVSLLTFNEQKVVSLAEAIPADKYDWRPEKGVRSVGEVLLHLAAANYFLFMQAGVPVPEGINPMSMESDIKGKEKIIDEVKKSLAWAREQAKAISDSELGDKVEMPFPGEFNKMSVIMICMDHCAEHMGQLIAYARMNGIAPPWSAGN